MEEAFSYGQHELVTWQILLDLKRGNPTTHSDKEKAKKSTFFRGSPILEKMQKSSRLRKRLLRGWPDQTKQTDQNVATLNPISLPTFSKTFLFSHILGNATK